MLVGLESYMKTTSKIKSAGKEAKHQKDKLLHPDKVRQEEEAKEDKSQSAEKERQHLAAAIRDQKSAKQSEKPKNGRFKGDCSVEEGKDADTESAVARGVLSRFRGWDPAPEGKR